MSQAFEHICCRFLFLLVLCLKLLDATCHVKVWPDLISYAAT